MSEPGDTGYWLVHNCEPGTFDHEDECNGIFVWADSSLDAIEKASVKDSNYAEDSAHAERIPCIDQHYEVLGELFGSGFGKQGPDQDRALRDASFREPGANYCESCGRYQFETLPESEVCEECASCAECGCYSECSQRVLREEKAS